MKIVNIVARQILDSRGTPTVEADVILESGVTGRAAVPSGASTGVHEAHELRDGGHDFGGKAVTKAVSNIHGEIKQKLAGMAADDQFLLDEMMNVLNGGQHAAHSSDWQEFMIIPYGANTYASAVQIGAEIFMTLKALIAKSGITTTVGDEGGFTYPVQLNTDMLELLNKAGAEAGYTPGVDYRYAIDVAASELYGNGNYLLQSEARQLDPAGMIEYIEQACKTYPIESVEDGLDQDAWDDWQKLTTQIGNHVQLVGDDLFVTNPERLQKGIDQKAGNAILIKPNQIGTLTETLKTIKLAQQHDWNTIISHRSGETEDVTIAHLAVGTGAGQIKTGSLSRSERTAKHNQLMRIEETSKLAISRPFDQKSV